MSSIKNIKIVYNYVAQYKLEFSSYIIFYLEVAYNIHQICFNKASKNYHQVSEINHSSLANSIIILSKLHMIKSTINQPFAHKIICKHTIMA